jgi:hypothetical protein
MPNKPVQAAAEGVPTFMDLEPLICDLRNMAALTDRVFDDYLYHALAMKFLDRDEADELCYAYKHIFEMTTDLRANFYRAVKNRAESAEPASTAPDSIQEIKALNARIDAHLSALARFAVVADLADAYEEETNVADDAEAGAFNELLKFPCQTKPAKTRKAEYIMEHLGKNRVTLELDVDQLKTLLKSLIQ